MDFSVDARRQWLADLDEAIANSLRYAFGPQLAPRVESAARFADMFNPVTGVAEAMQGGRQAVEGEGWDRVQGIGRMTSGMAATLAPMAGKADDAAKLIDALVGWSPARQGAADEAARFVGDESGAIRAYHASPHDFDKFSMDKIGTGEGAQAYGHGLYFADNEAVARSYQEAFTGRTDYATRELLRGHGHAVETAKALFEDGMKPEDISEWVKDVYPDLSERQMDAILQTARPARMYEVNINADPDDFLDWDKPLSEQSPNVRAYAESRRDKVLPGRDIANMDGDMLWKMSHPQSDLDGRAWLDTGPAEDASARIRDAGIPGIKYLDQGSRAAGEGSRNYVVFDDKLIDIVKKYGIAAAAPMLGMSVPEAQAAWDQQRNSGPLGSSPFMGMNIREIEEYLSGI